MIYGFSIEAVAWVTGLLLIGGHVPAVLDPEAVAKQLRKFPRSERWGTVLLAAAALWAWWLVATMDLGEFADLRVPMLVAIPAGFFLVRKFVDEFLAVRASGILFLLAAEVLLEPAFLRPEPGRLLLVVLAYVWALKGLFWVGMPYLMRDQIDWIARRPRWLRGAAAAGVAYGLAVWIFAWSLRAG